MKNHPDPACTVTEIALCCFVPPEGGTPVHKNRPCHGLALHVGGERRYRFSTGKSLRACAGDLIYLPKDSSYTVEKVEEGACYAINFHLSAPLADAPFVRRLTNVPAALSHFREGERVWKKNVSARQIHCKAELYGILSLLFREGESGYISGRSTALLQPALEKIHSSYTTETLTVPDLAALCGISEIYFRKLFTRLKGCSPLPYVRRLRLERAKELLGSGLYTVSQVSELSGFRDESYFSREFKKHTGLPPRLYRPTE